MKKLLCVSIFVLAVCAVSFAQDNKPSCPQFMVDSSPDLLQSGDTITFRVEVKDFDSKNLRYKWTVTGGEIINGHETSIITVKILRKPSGFSIRATAEIKGLPEGCPNTDTEVVIGDAAPEAEKFDEFGKATNGEVKMRVNKFILKGNVDPTCQGYIINYGSNKGIAKREQQLKNALAILKLDAWRITFVRGGESGKEIKTQFWIVPAGATPPTP